MQLQHQLKQLLEDVLALAPTQNLFKSTADSGVLSAVPQLHISTATLARSPFASGDTKADL